MCLKRNIEYLSATAAIDNMNEDFDSEWPLLRENETNLIIACNTCYYPVTLEDENNISFAI